MFSSQTAVAPHLLHPLLRRTRNVVVVRNAIQVCGALIMSNEWHVSLTRQRNSNVYRDKFFFVHLFVQFCVKSKLVRDGNRLERFQIKMENFI